MDPVIQLYDIEFETGVCPLNNHAFDSLVSLCHDDLGSWFEHTFSPLHVGQDTIWKAGKYLTGLSGTRLGNGRCRWGLGGGQSRGARLDTEAILVRES